MLQHMTVRISMLFALFLLTVATTWSQSVGAKAISSIEFKSGKKTAAVEGTVSPTFDAGPDMSSGGSEKYSLHLQSGRYLMVEISSDNSYALFSLIKPSPGMVTTEVVKRASGVKRWSGRITKSGNYLVEVFTREKATSHFKLRVTLR